MKKVLIALDYNPTAQKVAEQGYALAKSMNAEVVLLHVIADSSYYISADYSPIMGFNGYMDQGVLDMDNEDLKKISYKYLESTKIHLKDPKIQTVVAVGEIAGTILINAKKMHADVVVLGSHSLKWLENIVMGSVSKKILNNTSLPLYIIPTKYRK